MKAKEIRSEINKAIYKILYTHKYEILSEFKIGILLEYGQDPHKLSDISKNFGSMCLMHQMGRIKEFLEIDDC